MRDEYLAFTPTQTETAENGYIWEIKVSPMAGLAEAASSMTEYHIEHSEHVLTVRRTRDWFVGTLIAVLFVVAGMVLMGWEFFTQPFDRLSLFLWFAFVLFMLIVAYKLLFWGRCLIFDKQNNLFLLDGREVCALSDLISVQMEGNQRSPLAPNMGRLRGLHLRTTQGKDITLKWQWEANPEYSKLIELARVITDFVGTRSTIV